MLARWSVLLLLVCVCVFVNLRGTCRALPRHLPASGASQPGYFATEEPLMMMEEEEEGEEEGGEEEGEEGERRYNGTEWMETCGPCEVALCPDVRGCRAGVTMDTCRCCSECALMEGQSCDPSHHNINYGLCGQGMTCVHDTGDYEDNEPVCVCEQQALVCGSDGLSYLNVCQFKEASFDKPGLNISAEGPCKTAPIIKVPPHSQVNSSGSSMALLCEVFAVPMATVQWTKEGRDDTVLPGDDPHISVQSRGGPMRFELSSWLQIEGAGPEHSGTYRCAAQNNLGTVSATAVVGVLGEDELSTHLANSISEMKQLMEDTDYDRDYY